MQTKKLKSCANKLAKPVTEDPQIININLSLQKAMSKINQYRQILDKRDQQMIQLAEEKRKIKFELDSVLRSAQQYSCWVKDYSRWFSAKSIDCKINWSKICIE